jgi:hypothetical protein
MLAYCYASGLIELGQQMPEGAQPIALGNDALLRAFMEAVARHGYDTIEIDGRRQKIPGTDCLLVPGVPEAPDQLKAMDALCAWRSWIVSCAPVGIEVVA